MAESILRFKVDAKGAIQKINQVTSAAGRLGKSALGASAQLGGLAGIVGRLALVETVEGWPALRHLFNKQN